MLTCRVWTEATRGWGKLHYEELHDLYSLPHVTRRMRWANAYSTYGKEEKCIRSVRKI
jgi:hypothetical protein